MEKKIIKKQEEIKNAQVERARRKVIYDSQIVILEGQRNTVREIEARADRMMKDYVESDNNVSKLMAELTELSDKLEEKETG